MRCFGTNLLMSNDVILLATPFKASYLGESLINQERQLACNNASRLSQPLLAILDCNTAYFVMHVVAKLGQRRREAEIKSPWSCLSKLKFPQSGISLDKDVALRYNYIEAS